MIAVFVIIGVILVLLIAFIVIYNRLVKMHNQVKNAWAKVDVQLKRRHDLIPNLVETARGYLQHERQTLENVTNARNLAKSFAGGDIPAQAKIEGELSSFLSRLMVVVENYPDLKANQNFLKLQEDLTTTEDNISSARQEYNDMVRMCNNLHQMFPSNIVARVLGYHNDEFFEVKAVEERAVPRVAF